METRANYKGVVTQEASQEFSKTNGSVYVLHSVKIEEGPLKGKVVTATRTIKTVDYTNPETGIVKEGAVKEGVKIEHLQFVNKEFTYFKVLLPNSTK